jgi:hypothetical protein
MEKKQMKMNNLITVLAIVAVIAGCGIAPLSPAPKIETAPIQAAASQASDQVGIASTTVDAKAKDIQSHSTAAATAPTTQAVKPHLVAISADATSLVGVAVDLRGIQTSLRQVQSDLAGVQKQVDQLRADYAVAQQKVLTAQASEKAAIAKYDTSWFGGKMVKAFWWATAGVIAFFVGDFVLYYFTAGWSLNPFLIFVNMVGMIWSWVKGVAAWIFQEIKLEVAKFDKKGS